MTKDDGAVTPGGATTQLPGAPPLVKVMAFGFKHGLPADADYVADVRFLDNPFWVDELRELSGFDAPVRSYVLAQPAAQAFIDAYLEMLAVVLAGHHSTSRQSISVAIGCTGGRHRSVAVGAEVAARLHRLGYLAAFSARDLDVAAQEADGDE